ncbi:carotenoid oxygenase [Aspergillus karnatakaensis]|uniref:carotenoid oxygenase family protein n=1 Tax=Aspergillus karnatakaensis TaxID=1810916 RepID=UPI003CCD50A1
MAHQEGLRAPFRDWPNDAGFEAMAETRTPVELQVVGSLPNQLAGTLYRIGPGTYKVKGSHFQLSHWFDGFSFVHRFELVPQFTTGTCKVLYNSRGQVDALVEEARKSGTLKGMTFGQKRDPCESIFRKVKSIFHAPFSSKDPGLVNAGVTLHANAPGVPEILRARPDGSRFRSLTSLTDANVLKHIDPETLEPIGVTRQSDLHSDLKGPLSCAHAEFDTATGDAYNYNLDIGRYATYRIFRTSAQTGQTEIIATITGPDVKAAYLHSFFLSTDYVILCIWPALYGAGGLKLLWERNIADALHFDHNVQARWYVVDRLHGKGVVATYVSPAFFSFHTVNAWQETSHDASTDVICDIIQYPTDEMIQRAYYDTMASTGPNVTRYYGSELSRPSLVRYRLPSVSHTATEERTSGSTCLPQAEPMLRIDDDCVGDLPTINPHFKTRKTRYVYNIVNQGKSSFFDAIAKIDLETQESWLWEQDRHTPGEAIFIPDGEEQAEDAGYLVSVVLNGDTGTSYLLCLDARTMLEVGRAVCDSAIGFGFHGSYYPSHSL